MKRKRAIVSALAVLTVFALAVCAAQAAPSSPVPDETLIQQMDAYFAMTKDEILAMLGADYQVVPAGPEGVCDGYFYEELGLTFAFYPDEDALELIDCDEPFRFNGVGTGSLFSEITAALGDGEINETWMELPEYTVFTLAYHWGDTVYCFIAFEADEPVSTFWIYQIPDLD